jgi:hypothetical protein
MSENGLFSGYNGVAPQHMRAAHLPRPLVSSTKLHPVSPLPGIVREAKPHYTKAAVSSVAGLKPVHMNMPSVSMEKVKPSATKSTPGMIKLEMR